MNFAIRWRDAAIDDLAAAWLNADPPQRAAITQATHSIEQELKFQPIEAGESRPEGERIMFCAPVGVLFHVEEQEAAVIIEQAWLFSTR
ncbi:MAG TPA: hypothetical protein PK867_10780 [Pirellulales bacterium]|nr:hypothetical protein [Pirellulales bacterium]